MKPSQRPAETLTAGAALAFLLARALGIHDDTVTYAIVVALGALPATVTWAVVTWRKRKA